MVISRCNFTTTTVTYYYGQIFNVSLYGSQWNFTATTVMYLVLLTCNQVAFLTSLRAQTNREINLQILTGHRKLDFLPSCVKSSHFHQKPTTLSGIQDARTAPERPRPGRSFRSIVFTGTDADCRRSSKSTPREGRSHET